MKTIKMFMAYFGKLPNYFDLWLSAVEHNSTIDFVIISDCNFAIYDLPQNVKVISMSFDDFKDKIQSKFDFKISLESPGRVSQFRPALAYVFDNEVVGYDCWGFIECDLILGDIRAFITDDILDEYDKIFKLGHFQIFKNNPKMNTLFMQTSKSALNYRFAFSKNIFYFEELLGMQNLANSTGCKTYTENIFADIKSYKYKFELSSYAYPSVKNESYGICSYEDGKLYWFESDDTSLNKKEIIYVHLQKRKMGVCTDSVNEFLIIPNKFIQYKKITCELYNEIMEQCTLNEDNYQKTMKHVLSDTKRKHYRKFCWWQLKLIRKRIIKNGGIDLDGKESSLRDFD